MIPAYSPEARGRSERNFSTWQGRLPQELRLHQIETLEAANQFLREHYVAEFNRRFQVMPAQRGNAFVPCRNRDLERIFSLQFERSVNRDNTELSESQPADRAGALASHVGGLRGDGASAPGWNSEPDHGPHCLGRYTAQGAALEATNTAARRALEKPLRGKVIKPTFPPSLEIPQSARDSHFPTTPATAAV